MSNPKVLAVVNDLFFASKINEAAKHASVQLVYVTNEAALLEKAKDNPALIIFDLNFTAAHPVELIAKLKGDDALSQIRLLAYLSHVQVDLKQAAEQAGCDEVLPRSAFSMNLPQILKSHAGTA